jgi:hypothetical protein
MSHGTPAIHANHDEPTKDNAKPITSRRELPVGHALDDAL